MTMIHRNDYLAAIPLFERAIALDPNFAMAYARLGINFFNQGESGRAALSLQKAYDLRDRLSEREKLYITASYNAMAMRDFAAARQSYELRAQIYPRDQFAVGNLGVVYGYLGDYANIVETLMQLDRLDEAQATAMKAKALNLESQSLHSHLYALDFLRHNAAGMQQEATELAGKPGWADVAVHAHCNTAADAATRDYKKETAAAYEAEEAVHEALVGNKAAAIQQATTVLSVSNGKTVQTLAAVALGLAGDATQAGNLADDVAHNYPQDTVIKFNAVPAIRAASAFGAGNSGQAIQALQVAHQCELGQTDQPVGFSLYPVYLRAETLVTKQPGEAIAQYQKILKHPGIALNDPIAALAQPGLA